MYRIAIPSSDASLSLTPRFSGLATYFQLGLIGILFLFVLFLCIRLYRRELKLVSGRMALFLLSLRLLLIAALFLVAMFQPMLTHSTNETVPSRILVGVDRSDSMGVADPQRSAMESLEIAAGLNLADDLASKSEIETWLSQLRDGATPGSSKYPPVLEQIQTITRIGLARQALSPDGANLLKGIADKHALELIAFTQQSGDLPVEWEKLAVALDDKNALQQGASYTDLKVPLVRAIERGGLGEGKLLGIVLLTDGQHNWGASPVAKALELGGRSVPIYFIATGAKDPPPDLAILSVKATPPTVFKNAYAAVEVRLLINNLPAGKIKVTLKYPETSDGKPREPLVEEIAHDGTSGPRMVTFQARMDRPGTETLTATAEHIPNDPNDSRKETRPENNTRKVSINVAPDKAKVLLVDGEVRWEFHYLQTALIRDETMDTTSVAFEQPRLNLVDDLGVRRMGLPDKTMPKDPDDLMKFDCIILGDVAPDSLSKAERERLTKYVTERGGTLVLLAGKRSMPLGYLRDDEPLAKLLPVQTPKVANWPEGFKITLTPEGQATGFLRLDPNPGVSLERWAGLPKHYWGISGRAKDGATVLAYLPTGEVPVNAEAAREIERNNALIVRQNIGFGKVVYVGIDSTWRWRFKTGDEYNHRFWSQVIRWAASDRALVAGNDFVRFGVREPVYRTDQEAEVLVRISDKVKKLPDDALAGARFLRKTKPGGPEETVALVPLKPNANIPGELTGAQRDLPPGEYAMELAIPSLEDKLNGPDGRKLRATFQVLPADTGELTDLATNWTLMEEIANRSGGKVFPAAKAAELLEMLQSRSASREITIERKLNQSAWTLALLIFLLTVEWVTRKLVGLP